MPRLLITKGPGAGRDHAVGVQCIVGRGADVDFVLEDGGVSRRHLRVVRDGDAYVVEDLGSRNGTFVNGQAVQRAPLSDGSMVRAGGVEMVFRQKDLATPSPGVRAVPVVLAPRVVERPPARAGERAVERGVERVVEKAVERPVPAVPVRPTPIAPKPAPDEGAPPRKPLPSHIPKHRPRGVF